MSPASLPLNALTFPWAVGAQASFLREKCSPAQSSVLQASSRQTEGAVLPPGKRCRGWQRLLSLRLMLLRLLGVYFQASGWVLGAEGESDSGWCAWVPRACPGVRVSGSAVRHGELRAIWDRCGPPAPGAVRRGESAWNSLPPALSGTQALFFSLGPSLRILVKR